MALALANPIGGQERSSAPDATDQNLSQRVLPVRLENGWQFLLLSRPEVPSISFETCVSTGPAHEPPGLSGATSLVERMLFAGSDRVGTMDWPAEEAALAALDEAAKALLAARENGDPELAPAEEAFRDARQHAISLADPGEYRRILENAGGGASLGSHLTHDETHLFVSLPSNRLELWCWMEAERFSRPVMRGFHAELDALREARARLEENHPPGLVDEALRRLARDGEGPTGELLGDLSRSSTGSFFGANYGPRFLTTAIVGDFDPATLEPMLKRYFGKIPADEPRPELAPLESPSIAGRRIELWTDAAPQVMMGWRMPPLGHPDRSAALIALRLLGGARSSPLRRLLVRQRSLATELTASISAPASRLGELAMIWVAPATGTATARLEELIHREIAAFASEGPTPEELSGAQRAVLAEELRRLRDNAAVAAGLIEYQVRAGDWSRFFDRPALADAVTVEDVQRVLGAYFTAEECLVATWIRMEED